MYPKTLVLLVVAIVAVINAYPAVDFEEEVYPSYQLQGFVDKNSERVRPRRAIEYFPVSFDDEQQVWLARQRRSLQPGGPDMPKQSGDGWTFNPSINRDKKGNTNTNVEVTHTGPGHEINAGWGKVVDGPGKAKPTWHADATFNW